MHIRSSYKGFDCASTSGDIWTLDPTAPSSRRCARQIDELVTRVTAVAQSYDDAADSAVADDLYAAERSLVNARRLVDRATGRLDA